MGRICGGINGYRAQRVLKRCRPGTRRLGWRFVPALRRRPAFVALEPEDSPNFGGPTGWCGVAYAEEGQEVGYCLQVRTVGTVLHAVRIQLPH